MSKSMTKGDLPSPASNAVQPMTAEIRSPAARAEPCGVAGDRGDVRAAFGQGLAQQVAGAFVQLALHQDIHQVDDRGGHAASGQAVSGFQA